MAIPEKDSELTDQLEMLFDKQPVFSAKIGEKVDVKINGRGCVGIMIISGMVICASPFVVPIICATGARAIELLR